MQVRPGNRERGVLFHTDAVQAPGKIAIDVRESGVDFLSLSGHKLHAPKGVGVLYLKRGTRFRPLLRGAKRWENRIVPAVISPYVVRKIGEEVRVNGRLTARHLDPRTVHAEAASVGGQHWRPARKPNEIRQPISPCPARRKITKRTRGCLLLPR